MGAGRPHVLFQRGASARAVSSWVKRLGKFSVPCRLFPIFWRFNLILDFGLFFLTKPIGKLYSSDKSVTSFANNAIIDVGCKSTQIQEAFATKAYRASS